MLKRVSGVIDHRRMDRKKSDSRNDLDGVWMLRQDVKRERMQ
jgi:hypothetical protein